LSISSLGKAWTGCCDDDPFERRKAAQTLDPAGNSGTGKLQLAFVVGGAGFAGVFDLEPAVSI
jgi:hypothetical protein